MLIYQECVLFIEVLVGDTLTLGDIVVSVTEKNIKYQQKSFNRKFSLDGPNFETQQRLFTSQTQQ